MTQDPLQSIHDHFNKLTNLIKHPIIASNAVSDFNKVGSAADSNAKKVAALRKDIEALKDKTITITVKYSVQGKPKGVQHGGSWIGSKATQIDGVNIAEHNKPELVSVLPLTNPNQNSDKTINLNTPNTIKVPTPEIRAPLNMGSMGSGQPVIVKGDMNIDVRLADGSVLAKAIKPFILDGYSGITS